MREIENVLQSALVLAEDGLIAASDILIDNALSDIGDGSPCAMMAAFRQSAVQA